MTVTEEKPGSELPKIESLTGPRDSAGHFWALTVCYYITPEDAKEYVQNPLHSFEVAGIYDQQGPGCLLCKMVHSELTDADGKTRPCPGHRPRELDTLRATGDSKYYGLDRKTRRISKHNTRKSKIRRGEDPDLDRTPEKDAYEIERDRIRDEAEAESKARTKAQNQEKFVTQQLTMLHRKKDRLEERAAKSGVAGERGMRELEAFRRRYPELPPKDAKLGDVMELFGKAFSA